MWLLDFFIGILMNNYVELKIYIQCVEQKTGGLTYLVFVETIHCVNSLWVHRPPEEIEVHRIGH